MIKFFAITGLVFWIFILLFIILNMIEDYKKKKKLEYYHDDRWCNKCQDITEHICYGSGFNECHYCLNCDDK